jgi:uncharacterized membrane protein
MNRIKSISAVILGLFLVFSGFNHFVNPEFYDAFIPDIFPKLLVNYAVGLVEVLFGVGLCVPMMRRKTAFGVAILMVIFLPIHIRDLFLENPAIGSQTVAIVRIPIQLLLIVWSWWLSRPEPNPA